jgi:ABC-type uncharacterized transport system permease subunit
MIAVGIALWLFAAGVVVAAWHASVSHNNNDPE